MCSIILHWHVLLCKDRNNKRQDTVRGQLNQIQLLRCSLTVIMVKKDNKLRFLKRNKKFFQSFYSHCGSPCLILASVFSCADLLWLIRLEFYTDAAKAFSKRAASLMQMPHWLLPMMTVYSVTPSHAQNEREIYSQSEDEGGRKGGRETETSYKHDSMCSVFPVSLRLLTSCVYLTQLKRLAI